MSRVSRQEHHRQNHSRYNEGDGMKLGRMNPIANEDWPRSLVLRNAPKFTIKDDVRQPFEESHFPV
jgi:hypothetical protein